jgi:hypothetical protein
MVSIIRTGSLSPAPGTNSSYNSKTNKQTKQKKKKIFFFFFDSLGPTVKEVSNILKAAVDKEEQNSG